MADFRVDVHHHFVPPFYADALKEGGGDPSGRPIPHWTPSSDASFNKSTNNGFTFLSITAPGAAILPPGPQQADFCRRANEYAAALRDASPSHYGFFATLPPLLDDPAAAHAELAYALDELRADGVVLYTRYGSGNCYLGHEALASTWALLEARKAVVFVHPTHPVDTALVNPALPQPMLDYPHETTRTAVDLIVSGRLRQCPSVRIILSHAGGTLPYLVQRPASTMPFILRGKDGGDIDDVDEAAADEISKSFVEDARSFYFDTALSSAPATLSLLKEFARPGHILFGSDYPYAPTPAIKGFNRFLDERAEIAAEAAFMRSVNFEAAVDLFPRLADLVGVSVGKVKN